MNTSVIILNEILKRNPEISYFVMDTHFCYTEMSQSHRDRVYRIWGLEPKIGQSIFEVFEGKKGVINLRSRLKKVLDLQETITQIESRHTKKLNTIIFIETSWIPLIEDGVSVGILCLAKDISQTIKHT